jgi:hypothetical protein
LLRDEVVAQVGQERIEDLSARFRDEAEFQREAFLALDDADREALLRRFWTPAGQEDRLGFSDEQWEKIGDLVARIRQLQKEMGEALAKHRRDLQKLIDQPSTTPRAFLTQLEAMRETRTRYESGLRKLRDQLRPLVTTEEEATLVVEGILD